MDISNLTPEQQQTFLSLLGQSNQQSMDPKAFGVNPPPQIDQQDGDKIHPMDAISQIGSQMFGPAKPQGVELATGPKLIQKGDQLMAELPANHPLLQAMGVKQHIPVDTPNYYEAAKKNNLMDQLPGGMAQMPDGTPFISKSMFEQALIAKKANINPNNPSYTKDEAIALFPGQADKLTKYFSKMPEGAAIPLTTIRTQVVDTGMQARVAGVAVARNKLESGLNTQFAKYISDAEQNQTSPMGISANLLGQAVAIRQGIATRYNPNTDEYDMNKGEVGDLMLSTARMLVRKGQLTNEQLDAIKQETAYGRLNNAAQFFFGKSFNGNTQDIIRRSLQIVDKEGLANEALRNMYARQNLSIGEPLRIMNPALYNTTLANSFGGVNYTDLLSKSPDTQSPNYLVPNIVPISQSGVIPMIKPGVTDKSVPPAIPNPQPTKKVKTASDYLSKFGGK